MMSDPAVLVSRVRAALDDLERLALAADPAPAAEDVEFGDTSSPWTDEFASRGGPVFAHVLRHDPAAVLRLVGALREIVDRYEFVTGHGPAVDHVRALDMSTGAAAALRFAVERLAHGLGIDTEEDS